MASATIRRPGDLVWYSPDQTRWYLAQVFQANQGFTELDFAWGAREWAIPERVWAFEEMSATAVKTWRELLAAYFGEERPDTPAMRRELRRVLVAHGVVWNAREEIPVADEDERAIA